MTQTNSADRTTSALTEVAKNDATKQCQKAYEYIRVGHGSGPSMGRVGSQNSPSWVDRVGSGPVLIISNKCAIYMQKLSRLLFLIIRSYNIAIFIRQPFTYLFHFSYLVAFFCRMVTCGAHHGEE